MARRPVVVREIAGSSPVPHPNHEEELMDSDRLEAAAVAQAEYSRLVEAAYSRASAYWAFCGWRRNIHPHGRLLNDKAWEAMLAVRGAFKSLPARDFVYLDGRAY